VNTFTEANFSVLTERVGVSATMTASTFVRREDLSQVSRLNKLAYAAHRDSTRAYSHVTKTEWTKKLEVAESLMLPKPLAILKNQVLLGASCARSAETKMFVCTNDNCAICKKYLTKTQGKCRNAGTVKVHILAFLDEGLTKKVRFSHLPADYVDLLRTAPRPKYWRVVTVTEEPNGCRLLCSCGYGKRHMTCCLHVSMVIQMASNYTACGSEEEAIHIRHTNLYASMEDITKVERNHDDWQGVICSNVTIEGVKECFAERPVDEDDATGNISEEPPQHGHGTRYQGQRKQISADEASYKAEKIGILRSRLFELVNIVESATSKKDVDDFCAIVEDGVFAIRRQLPALPARTATTVAKRPLSEKARSSSRRQRQQQKKAAQEGIAPKAMRQRARASRAFSLQKLQGGHAAGAPILIGSSDKSDDKSSEISTIVCHTYASDSDSQTSRSSMSASSRSSAYSYM
jgi:hypothetical protein